MRHFVANERCSYSFFTMRWNSQPDETLRITASLLSSTQTHMPEENPPSFTRAHTSSRHSRSAAAPPSTIRTARVFWTPASKLACFIRLPKHECRTWCLFAVGHPGKLSLPYLLSWFRLLLSAFLDLQLSRNILAWDKCATNLVSDRRPVKREDESNSAWPPFMCMTRDSRAAWRVAWPKNTSSMQSSSDSISKQGKGLWEIAAWPLHINCWALFFPVNLK